MMEKKNAIIKSAELVIDDHNLLTAWLSLDYGGSGQGFGGYALYLPKSFTRHGAPNYAGHFIWRVMEIVGVKSWIDLPGKTIRVMADHSGVEAIGNIIEDEWFRPRHEFEIIKKESIEKNGKEPS